jgi:multidrug efflux system outer membrane protein
MRNLLLYAVLSLTLTACAVGPDYTRPDVQAPARWQVSYEEAADVADTAWWEQFQDPVLTDLIRTTLQENKDLKVAAARVDQFLGALDTTRSQFFPQVGYGAGAVRQQDTKTGPAPGISSPYSTFQASLNAGWEIDLWGRIRRSSEAAQALVLASEEGRRGVILTLVTGVANSYLALQGLDRQLEIARSTENSYGESLKLFNLRYEHGTISLLELSQVESQYESARQAIPFYEGQVARQEYLISLLLGREPGPIPRGRTIDQMTPLQLPDELPLSLLERRPDIRQAEQELIAANAQIGAAKALYFPTISLAGILGYQSAELDRLFQSRSGIWSFGGSAVGPLLTFGAISGQVKQAEAIQQQAVHRYEQQILSAFKDVEDALVGTVKGREQLDSQGRQVKALAEYAKVARLQYEGGITDYLKVLDAERSLFNAQLTYVQTQTGVFLSAIDLYKAMGGGLTQAEALAATDGDVFPCMTEIERFCRDVEPGSGRLLKCLSDHDGELSPACRAKLDKARARVEEARRLCAPDLEKFCPDVEPGQGRLLSCLKGKLDQLSPACQEQVVTIGAKAAPRQ